MRFEDIPTFTKSGTYEVDVPINYIERTLAWYKDDYDLDLDPDFQRGNVWTESQQIAYLEFFFRGEQTSRVIYFNCPSFGNNTFTDIPNMVIVDGKQRLTAFRRFLNNEIPIFNTFFNDFEDRLSATKFLLKFNINDLPYRKDVLQWYLDMNTGGTVHSRDEINRVKKLLENELNK